MKKLITLVLVMLIGMMMIPANAMTYYDWVDTFTYEIEEHEDGSGVAYIYVNNGTYDYIIEMYYDDMTVDAGEFTVYGIDNGVWKILYHPDRTFTKEEIFDYEFVLITGIIYGYIYES